MRISDGSSDVCSSDLIKRNVAGIEASARPQANGDRRIEMAAGNMTDRIDHGHHRQAKGQRNAEEADPQIGKARRDHRAAAAAENQPEGADELGQRSDEHTSEPQSLMRRSYAVNSLQKTNH